MATTKISVVLCFFDMPREARRTLHSLTSAYQLGVDDTDYEIIAIDNGSSRPLDPDWVASLGPQFSYASFDARSPSPCAAVNNGVERACGEFVMCCIDGARILSPGMLRQTILATRLYPSPFIYCINMHIGPHSQNVSMVEGYDQAAEDELLATVDWPASGYSLFGVSTPVPPPVSGFFSQLAETNCFTLRKTDYLELGGFDERFVEPGGGLANLDIFNRVHANEKLSPILLLGEATFHQFHGGVATNVPLPRHPFMRFAQEYERIRGRAFTKVYRRPDYFGSLPRESLRLAQAPLD